MSSNLGSVFIIAILVVGIVAILTMGEPDLIDAVVHSMMECK